MSPILREQVFDLVFMHLYHKLSFSQRSPVPLSPSVGIHQCGFINFNPAFSNDLHDSNLNKTIYIINLISTLNSSFINFDKIFVNSFFVLIKTFYTSYVLYFQFNSYILYILVLATAVHIQRLEGHR